MEEQINRWKDNCRDAELKEEFYSLNGSLLKERFSTDLHFGTGGLRGIIGVGTNCMNIYTVARVSRGIAAFMRRYGMSSVAISYDSRKNSKLFAQTAAYVFAENGISVVMVKELMPTPFLSFLTREAGCNMGIMITASHNPAQYNGYKVYNASGCQITDKVANEILEFIEAEDYFNDKEGVTFDDFVKTGKIKYSSEIIEEKYLEGIRKNIGVENCELDVTYTALNGTGYRLLPKLLESVGVRVKLVKEQCVPDESFKTCPCPNPERTEALELGLSYAEKFRSDILIATDPDADRVGIAVWHEGKYVRLTGNQIGLLLTQYLLEDLQKKGQNVSRAILIKTIVTTQLAEKIVKYYGAQMINVLTGFKYIGEQICKLEEVGEKDRFLLGFEESYGYLLGTQVRDKDAIITSLAICKMVSDYKSKGKDLLVVLNEIYHKFGGFENKLLTYEFKGCKAMGNFMVSLRKIKSESFLSKKLVKITDYKYQETGLPKSDVISFDLENDINIVIRPSGTEPLLKIYLAAPNKSEIDILERQVNALIKEWR